MSAIYRQYRPTTFAEIVGQDHITSILGNQVVTSSLAHAYLFQGPRGTGKTTTARVFAKRLNCSNSKTAEPCGTCATCTAFQEGKSLDVIEIDAASNRGIDDIRALRETVSLAPTMGKYKLFIIDEVHMLSGPAFAALLKTLEEPPKHVIFMLATTELQKVPATIASRCQLFRFRRATNDEMRSRLQHILKQEERTAEDDLLSFIISRSDGCYRDAESLLGQLLSHTQDTLTSQGASKLLGIPSREAIHTFLSALVEGNAAQALKLATTAYEEGFDPEQFLQEAIREAREGVVRAITNDTPPIFASTPNAVERLTSSMRAFLVATQDLAYVPEPMIALELAIVTACVAGTPAKAPTPSLVTPIAAPVVQVKAVAPVAKKEPPSNERLLKIQSSWEAIIQYVRTTNPVASTFLRATQPVALSDSSLLLRMQFPLHKTFFEKPENLKVVQDAIQKVT